MRVKAMTSLSNLGGAKCGVPGSFSQDPAAWVVMGYHNDEDQCNRQYIHALTRVWVAVLGMREPPPPHERPAVSRVTQLWAHQK